VWKTLGAGAQRRQVGAILVLAFLLRVAGNLYDMPDGFHPDEKQYLQKAKRMLSEGTLDPVTFINPPLYSYAIRASLYVLFGVQWAAGGVASRPDFIATLKPSLAFGIARGLTALAGTTICLLLFLIGRRFGGDLAGLLAACFYAVAFLSVRDAHFAVNDIPMVCLVTLAFLFAVRLLEGGRTRDLVIGGLVAGLAAATKYNGVIALLPLLVACVLGRPGREGAARPVRSAELAGQWMALVLMALAGFVLGNPYAVLDSPTFLSGLSQQYEYRGTVWRGQSIESVPILALESLVVELGAPLVILFPFAAAYCLYLRGARARATLLALSVILTLVVYHASHTLFFARFLLPCTPFIALVSAWGIVAFREACPAPWVRRPIVLWTGVALLVASPLARSIYLDLILQRPDTRLLAKAYLDRVAPPGSVVIREKPSHYTPALDPKRYRLLTLSSDPSLLHPAGQPGDFYLFNSFDTGRVAGILEAEERVLMAALERLGFSRITFSPLRDGGELPFQLDQVYLPYRHLYRYVRPGPTIVIYAHPGTPVPPLSGNRRGTTAPMAPPAVQAHLGVAAFRPLAVL